MIFDTTDNPHHFEAILTEVKIIFILLARFALSILQSSLTEAIVRSLNSSYFSFVHGVSYEDECVLIFIIYAVFLGTQLVSACAFGMESCLHAYNFELSLKS